MVQTQAGNADTQQAQSAAAHLISLQTSLTSESVFCVLKFLKKRKLLARFTHRARRANASTPTPLPSLWFLSPTELRNYIVYKFIDFKD